ncbi:group I truncated hemoglobin [Terrimonas alba]|uniref:group I truncated hemoglobin n=1 Tax=Terrimonas alba TaxID=3349636 RepID=UPI0035F4396A
MENTSPTTQKPSLYERLGGEQGLRKIVNDILDKNFSNPKIGHHFKNVDMDKLKQLVFEFFSMGIGGSHIYTGRDMRSAHADLGISQRDFSLGNDDVSEALKENGVSKAEIDEVIGILNSMKGDVVTV